MVMYSLIFFCLNCFKGEDSKQSSKHPFSTGTASYHKSLIFNLSALMGIRRFFPWKDH